MLRAVGLLILLLGWTPAARAQTSARAVDAGFTLQPGDVVRVNVWREEDLSGEFPVDAQGTVILPLIGPVRVAGVPLAVVTDTVLTRYRVELRNPSITIVPLRRIFVLGEVSAPGPYLVDPTTTLAGVIAEARGANPIGDLRKIRVVRGGQVVQNAISVDQAMHVSDLQSGDQVYVPRTHWASRNAAYLLGIGLSLFSIALQLFN